MPDVPTMIEAGYPSVVSTTYYGLYGRADLPAAVVNRLNTEVAEILKDGEVEQSLGKIGFEPKALPVGELKALLAREAEKWIPIAKASGFQM